MRTLKTELERNGLTKKRYQECAKYQNEPQKKRTEQLSKFDIEELMGVRRPRYTRRKGAIRQK